MRPSSRKAKGRILQQLVSKQITQWGNLPEEDVVSRPMGSAGEDIMMSARARELLPLTIECKNTKAFPSLAALRQCDYNCPDHLTPAVCWHAPGSRYDETLIYFRLSDFLALIDRLRKVQE